VPLFQEEVEMILSFIPKLCPSDLYTQEGPHRSGKLHILDVDWELSTIQLLPEWPTLTYTVYRHICQMCGKEP
jgi:hypothetical protein